MCPSDYGIHPSDDGIHVNLLCFKLQLTTEHGARISALRRSRGKLGLTPVRAAMFHSALAVAALTALTHGPALLEAQQ